MYFRRLIWTGIRDAQIVGVQNHFVMPKIVGVPNYFVTNLPPTPNANGCGQDGEAHMSTYLPLSGSGTRKVHRPAISKLTPPMPSAQIGCV